MSKKEQEEPDYKNQIKRRAQQTSGLRQQAFEKAGPIGKVESNPPKEKRKSATG
jgi:hypothetical protein